MNAMLPHDPTQSATIEADRDRYVDYFAYGSNLSTRQMKQRIGSAPVARLALLKDYHLVFNCQVGDDYFANIVPSPGQCVWGVIYRCELRAMLLLDRYEGVGQGCYRRLHMEVETDGLAHFVEVYVASPAPLFQAGLPTADYLARIISGAKEHLLPEDYIQAVERLGRPNS